MSMGIGDQNLHMLTGGILGQCGHPVEVSPSLFKSYFAGGGTQTCPAENCGRAIDLWEAVKACFLGAGAAFSLLTPLGGMSVWTTIQIEPGEFFELDLETLGVASDDIVRGITLTGFSHMDVPPVTPALIFGNQPRLPVHLPHQLTFFGVNKAGGQPVTQVGNFNVHVQFLPKQETPYRQLLLGGVIALGDGDKRGGVIDAHTAADIALDSFTTQLVQQLTPYQEPRLGFLEKVGMLMVARSQSGLPPVPEPLLKTLGVLNQRRNWAVHPSRVTRELTDDVAADCLTASLFLIHLVELSTGAENSDSTVVT